MYPYLIFAPIKAAPNVPTKLPIAVPAAVLLVSSGESVDVAANAEISEVRWA